MDTGDIERNKEESKRAGWVKKSPQDVRVSTRDGYLRCQRLRRLKVDEMRCRSDPRQRFIPIEYQREIKIVKVGQDKRAPQPVMWEPMWGAYMSSISSGIVSMLCGRGLCTLTVSRRFTICSISLPAVLAPSCCTLISWSSPSSPDTVYARSSSRDSTLDSE